MDRIAFPSTPSLEVATGGLKRSALISALSYALDLTEGQPAGHSLRCCWIGMQLASRLGLDGETRSALYYTLLLKDLGCSSNAARICELYLTDDRQFKQDFKAVGDSLPQMLQFVFRHTGLRAGTLERLRAVLNILRNGTEIADELIHTRCHRGADIARQLRFPVAVSDGIRSLDEHWNGAGRPEGLAGEAIPLPARIALLAQVVDVFQMAEGPDAAMAEVRRRAGGWFDPQLATALLALGKDATFWQGLRAADLGEQVLAMAPDADDLPLDDDYLDDIVTAFGQVVDSKSPYTSGHSLRVATYADEVACRLGLPADHRRWLQRGALLHDVGKLGVSNSILDKPGPLDADEWTAMRQHAVFTEEILSRLGAFTSLARVAAAHHERLDGGGYPRGLQGADITLETRIITVADIFDALTAERPYRAAMPTPKALGIMTGMVGTALDPLCFEALADAVTRPVREGGSPV